VPKNLQVLLTLATVALLVNYVETMVVPALPTIQSDFSTTSSLVAWVTSAYLIVGSAASPLFGKLGDLYGKKRLYLISLGFYIISVALAGFSTNIYFLIFARALQGLGFSVFPLGLAIITDTFPKERVATAQGVLSGTIGIGTALGLVVGAYIDQDLGWQYAFHIAALLGILLLVVSSKTLESDVSRPKEALDIVGSALLMTGISLLLVYTTEGPYLGWFSALELILLALGAVLTIGFFVYESRARSPLIQLGLLKIRNVFVSNIVGIVSSLMLLMMFFAVIYYTEIPPPFGLGLDVISAGLTLAPATVVMLVVGPIVGRLTGRIGPKPVLLFGSLVCALGFYLFLLNRSTSSVLVEDVIVTGIGMISIIVPIVNMVAVSLPEDSRAVGLGMNTMLRNLGGAIGPVVATTIMTSYQTAYILTTHGELFYAGSFPLAIGFNTIFKVDILISVITFALSAFSKNYTTRSLKLNSAYA
jgi:EmrB/QacA subfamily drug resistance transporter